MEFTSPVGIGSYVKSKTGDTVTGFAVVNGIKAVVKMEDINLFYEKFINDGLSEEPPYDLLFEVKDIYRTCKKNILFMKHELEFPENKTKKFNSKFGLLQKLKYVGNEMAAYENGTIVGVILDNEECGYEIVAKNSFGVDVLYVSEKDLEDDFEIDNS